MTAPECLNRCLFIGGRAGRGLMLDVDSRREHLAAIIDHYSNHHRVECLYDPDFDEVRYVLPAGFWGYETFTRYHDPSRETFQYVYLKDHATANRFEAHELILACIAEAE